MNPDTHVVNPQIPSFQESLARLINCYSLESGSDTPDFILAEFVVDAIKLFDKTVKKRDEWYGNPQKALPNLRGRIAKSHEEICQTLGRALNYPAFADDQKNFPGATDEDGVCVGDHVAETLAMEAADKIGELNEIIARYEELDNLENDPY